MKAWMMVVALGLGATGCADDYRISFEELTSPVGFASVSYEEIRIDQGTALAVIANPVDEDGHRLDLETVVELVAESPGILGISRLEFDQEAEEDRPDDLRRGDWRFVLYGKTPGNTFVHVWIDGEIEGEIPAVVDEPRP
jgi:hypothetical protein